MPLSARSSACEEKKETRRVLSRSEVEPIMSLGSEDRRRMLCSSVGGASARLAIPAGNYATILGTADLLTRLSAVRQLYPCGERVMPIYTPFKK
jgi:hypothetical protein